MKKLLFLLIPIVFLFPSTITVIVLLGLLSIPFGLIVFLASKDKTINTA